MKNHAFSRHRVRAEHSYPPTKGDNASRKPLTINASMIPNASKKVKHVVGIFQENCKVIE